MISVQLDPGIGPGLPRRTLDIVAGVVGLAVAGLPLLLLMAAVRLTSPGPALFHQIRLGQGGRPFALAKLRSMRVGEGGPEITAAGDARVTRLGRFLRSTSLDELPQLWHVVRGTMTLVGPRPETPTLAAGYPSHCQWIFRYRPGLTGPAQVRMRDRDVLPPGVLVDTTTYLTRLVPARVALDAQFLAQPTLRNAAGVIADTVRHIIGRPVPPRRSGHAWAATRSAR
jgi:lipopolysaccharide/colanic/teichoic acid biosynthesis glycosyltransferase